MKVQFRSLAISAAAAALVAGVGLMAGGGSALAAGGGGPTPPWYPLTPAPYGSLTFYNAQGQVVTGGSINSPGLAAYTVASAPEPTSGYNKATLYLYSPESGTPPQEWPNEQFSESIDTYPNAAAPAPIGTTANPVSTNTGDDLSIASIIANIPNTSTTSGYVGLYDVRMMVGGPGLSQDPTFWDTVISVNTTTNTWSVDYPDYTQNTTTTLTANPPSPQETTTPSPVTLTATVAPATAGTVSFWSGTTQVGATQTVTSSSGTASVTVTPPAGATTPYQAVFTPTVGSADIGSASNTINYLVGAPPDSTATTLAESGGGGPAGPVTFTGSVSDTTTTGTTVSAGTVSLYDNGSTTPFATTALSSTGTFSATFTYTSAGSHSVVATYSGTTSGTPQFAGSSSSAVTFSETAPACTTCSTVATIEGTVPAGTISISTPYTATNPLNLGTLALNSSGTYFSASASLDSGSGDVPGVNFNGITVVDTQSGNLPWTVSALASNLTDGTGHPGGTISGENVGLTNLTPIFVSGNAIQTGDVTVTDQPAAAPPVAPTDTGSQGLGGTTAHQIAADSAQPDGTVGINGTVTLNAPTSTEAGIFVGTITFTIAS
jgi:hypothetical protein